MSYFSENDICVLPGNLDCWTWESPLIRDSVPPRTDPAAPPNLSNSQSCAETHRVLDLEHQWGFLASRVLCSPVKFISSVRHWGRWVSALQFPNSDTCLVHRNCSLYIIHVLRSSRGFLNYVATIQLNSQFQCIKFRFLYPV